ncbi:uncharacterized protein [Nicotiana tomentosiformis]|uniref:uncharacterized protein n=1 Tax=Nicotiana tomentosiformis TaxID=4098 RepID=UPI00388CC065
MGSSLFWYKNWTWLGALYFLMNPDFAIDEFINNVSDVVVEDSWDVDKLLQILPEEYVVHIVEKIRPPTTQDALDIPFWSLESRGNFIVSSAWNYLRRRQDQRNAFNKMWVKGMPFKISFFLWKAATKVWSYFLTRAGINMEGLTLHRAIVKCWTATVIPKLEPILQALPAVIIWELWKRRNNFKHGEVVLVSRVIYQASSVLQSIVKVRKPTMLNVPHKWLELLQRMENYTPDLQFKKVLWEFPALGWIKVNTDGASRGNPGRSSIGFVLRNEEGNVVYARGKEIPETTNNEAEAWAILEGLSYCVNQQYTQVLIQTDLMPLKNVLDEVWIAPWNVTEIVEEINKLRHRCTITFTQLLREGNRLADYLANYALDFGNIEATGFTDLDTHGKKIVNNDKMQCPYLRVKPKRN